MQEIFFQVRQGHYIFLAQLAHLALAFHLLRDF